MLVLASASPRRHELLLAAGLEHIVRAADIDESPLPGEAGRDLVLRLARKKALATSVETSDIILSADTVVVVGNRILNKPRDSADARWMLGLLSGRDHWVNTGICLRQGDQMVEDVAATRVSFNVLSEPEIESYVCTGEPFDKAGAYAIQGLASKFIRSIEGSYHNVVGLPVSLVYEHLKHFQRRRI